MSDGLFTQNGSDSLKCIAAQHCLSNWRRFFILFPENKTFFQIKLWLQWMKDYRTFPGLPSDPGCYGRSSLLWFWLCAPHNPAPSPFHCLPVNPGYFGRTSWLSWFSRKKSRGRNGQEATLKQPRKLIFQSWNQIFGQVTRQWAWPTGTTQKESTSSAIYCKITISFGEILIFTSTVLGGLFLQIFKPGFLTFSQWDYHPALPG